jgi:hypothetical protein
MNLNNIQQMPSLLALQRLLHAATAACSYTEYVIQCVAAGCRKNSLTFSQFSGMEFPSTALAILCTVHTASADMHSACASPVYPRRSTFTM